MILFMYMVMYNLPVVKKGRELDFTCRAQGTSKRFKNALDEVQNRARRT